MIPTVGCDVEDIITDIELNAILDTFLHARGLIQLGYDRAGHIQLEKSGLMEEPFLIVELEGILAEHGKEKAKAEKFDREHQKLYKAIRRK